MFASASIAKKFALSTNQIGDAIVWRDMWPAIAAFFGMPVGESRPMHLAEEMPKRADQWERIAEQHGLRLNSMQAIVGSSWRCAMRCPTRSRVSLGAAAPATIQQWTAATRGQESAGAALPRAPQGQWRVDFVGDENRVAWALETVPQRFSGLRRSWRSAPRIRGLCGTDIDLTP
ncbi:hypothetical protein [Aquabacterium sp.]|uniref:hypothetical protein n=1 Tax=Aquabacterium sp. TaxID=1872578 RepID=UPI002BEFABDF|nr:hypothetical protein [Aquabacterium sp.]HSW07999.1 hypothetical protein [Aquabacterium sp.]